MARADIVLGTQYGDEGKAKIVDSLAENYDVVARFNGGANAGHSLEANGIKVAVKQIPSGIFYPEKILYIGSGCVVNFARVRAEVESLKEVGIEVRGRLKISSQAGVIQPHHILIDSQVGGKVGTTKEGIGPAYADRASRMHGGRVLNIRIGEVNDDPDKFFKLMRENFEALAGIYGFGDFDIEQKLKTMREDFEVIRQFVEMDTLYLQKKIEAGSDVLFEGAQAYMLDVNKGSVPYVTSSSTCAGAAYVGGDLSPEFHGKTIGIAKAIMSRVGHGPFTSEFGRGPSEEYCMSLNDDGTPTFGKAVEAAYDVEELLKSDDPFELSKAVRVLSFEYGTVTTRPRRVGMLDLVQLKNAVKTNGIKELVLTKCDLLNIFARTKAGKIPIVTGYKLDGGEIDYIPGPIDAYARVEPIVEERDAFAQDVSGLREWDDLPIQLKEFLREVEERVECKISGIGVGPDREQFIKVG